MKVITIQQPHVEAIFAGLKLYETRSWPTSYRGPLAIHAGKKVDADAEMLGFPRGTLGCIVGIVELRACLTSAAARRLGIALDWGDFSPGRFAFELREPRRFGSPIPARGQLGIWNYPDVVEMSSLMSAAD